MASTLNKRYKQIKSKLIYNLYSEDVDGFATNMTHIPKARVIIMESEVPVSEAPSKATFKVPIIFGNSAVALKNQENDHTHKWTVFVRGFNNEDISTYVRKVVFKLHESFLQPIRGIPVL